MAHKIWESFPEIAEELDQVKCDMKLAVQVPLDEIQAKIIQYIDAPGKYVRSGLMLMTTEGLALSLSKDTRQLASAIELFHLATLIHDDVIDDADTRRGIKPIHVHQSNRIAIYAGDYLLALSLRLVAEVGRQDQNISLTHAQKRVMEHILIGEMRQLNNQFNKEMTMMEYLRQIKGKTAMLFGLSTLSGARGADLTTRQYHRLFYAGEMLGMAFQLKDDLIDYQSTQTMSGKTPRLDLKNGIYTAPYLLLKQYMYPEKMSFDSFDQLIYQMEQYNVIEKVEKMITDYLTKSMNYFKQVGVQSDKIESIFFKLLD